MKSISIDEIIAKRRIIITCGTGGVGKTTLSAAIAVRAAAHGKNAVVITIDPARRLATSLGLKSLEDHPTDLTPLLQQAAEKARAQGLDIPKRPFGNLSAIMPDTRKTFEEFVTSLSPSREIADRVMRNPIFQIFAKEFSGTNEYMALQRLYALDSKREFDCIILDTPPSRNTLAFLDAPQLLTRFFEERLIKWLVLPTNKLISMGMRKALGLLEKLTGAGFMTHLFDFAAALFEVRVGFTSNLKRITHLLESEDVGFLVVANASPDTAPDISQFIQSVHEHRFHFDGIALNRTVGYLRVPPENEIPPEFQGNTAIQSGLDTIRALQKRESESIGQLFANLSRGQDYTESLVYAKIPELARDVHSIEDLFHVAMAIQPNRGV